MNTKHILLGIILLALAIPGLAQAGGERDIESIRIGYITRQLNLTPAESQTFWPVYNQYQDEMRKFKMNRRAEMKDTRQNFDTMSDKEVATALDEFVALKQEELNLFMKYHNEFKKVLSPRKVAKLYQAEAEFTQKILERLQERRDNFEERNGGGPRFQR